MLSARIKKILIISGITGVLFFASGASYIYFLFGQHIITVCNRSDRDVHVSLSTGGYKTVILLDNIRLRKGDCERPKIRPDGDGYLIINIDGKSSEHGYITPIPFVGRHEFIIDGNVKYNYGWHYC